jgi:hypothetical protein
MQPHIHLHNASAAQRRPAQTTAQALEMTMCAHLEKKCLAVSNVDARDAPIATEDAVIRRLLLVPILYSLGVPHRVCAVFPELLFPEVLWRNFLHEWTHVAIHSPSGPTAAAVKCSQWTRVVTHSPSGPTSAAAECSQTSANVRITA